MPDHPTTGTVTVKVAADLEPLHPKPDSHNLRILNAELFEVLEAFSQRYAGSFSKMLISFFSSGYSRLGTTTAIPSFLIRFKILQTRVAVASAPRVHDAST